VEIAAGSPSDLTVVLLGMGGAGVTFVLTLVLPAALKLAGGGNPPDVTFWRALGVGVVVLIYVGAGAAAALYVGEADTQKDAVYYGMAWQSILGGVIKTGQAAKG
jgi:hypothetical protein